MRSALAGLMTAASLYCPEPSVLDVSVETVI